MTEEQAAIYALALRYAAVWASGAALEWTDPLTDELYDRLRRLDCGVMAFAHTEGQVLVCGLNDGDAWVAILPLLGVQP